MLLVFSFQKWLLINLKLFDGSRPLKTGLVCMSCESIAASLSGFSFVWLDRSGVIGSAETTIGSVGASASVWLASWFASVLVLVTLAGFILVSLLTSETSMCLLSGDRKSVV